MAKNKNTRKPAPKPAPKSAPVVVHKTPLPRRNPRSTVFER